MLSHITPDQVSLLGLPVSPTAFVAVIVSFTRFRHRSPFTVPVRT
jgi:hypothetical protein